MPALLSARLWRLVSFPVLAASLCAQCPGSSSLSLTVEGGRIGDEFRIRINGPAGAPGLLGLDLMGGNTPTPFGTICLGLSPALFLQPLTLDANGTFEVGGILAAGVAPPGLTLFHQAAVADPFAVGNPPLLSSGITRTWRHPKWFAFGLGLATFGVSPHLVAIDAVTDTVAYSVTPLAGVNSSSAFFYIPEQHEVGLLVQGGTLDRWNAETGTFLGSTPLPTELAQSGAMFVHEDGTALTAVVLQSPGTLLHDLRTYSLPSLQVISSSSLTGIASFTPQAISLHPIPGTSLVYLGLRTQPKPPEVIVPFDLATQTSYPPIVLGGGLGPIIRDYDRVLVGVTNDDSPFAFPIYPPSAWVRAIDLTTHSVTASLALGIGRVQYLAPSADAPGSSVFVGLNSLSRIEEVAPDLSAISRTIALPAPPGSREPIYALSAGSSEFLLLFPGQPPFATVPASLGRLDRIDVATGAALASIPLEADLYSGPFVLPSKTLRKAAFLRSLTRELTVFGTDTSTSPPTTIPLPGQIGIPSLITDR